MREEPSVAFKLKVVAKVKYHYRKVKEDKGGKHPLAIRTFMVKFKEKFGRAERQWARGQRDQEGQGVALFDSEST